MKLNIKNHPTAFVCESLCQFLLPFISVWSYILAMLRIYCRMMSFVSRPNSAVSEPEGYEMLNFNSPVKNTKPYRTAYYLCTRSY